MAENINLADPGAEQPTITLADGREIVVLTDGVMPYSKSLLTRRLIVRAANVERLLFETVAESMPIEADAETQDLNGKVDELQGELDMLTERATRMICPDLQDDDMPAFSREVHGIIHARFFQSVAHLTERLIQEREGTNE